MKTSSLEGLIGRLRRLKENVGFISNRVTAVQWGLDSWQAEQINRKLYCLSFLSIIFLPLSIITGGVPWTQQRDPKLKNGFRNVMLVCVGTLILVLLCFLFPFLYGRISFWRKQSFKKNLVWPFDLYCYDHMCCYFWYFRLMLEIHSRNSGTSAAVWYGTGAISCFFSQNSVKLSDLDFLEATRESIASLSWQPS
ncbi:putative phytepsin [Helianthus annuus]|nr:putative phytepsin [Helianthus annuus]KAJ0707532.1 putative phytepsin [Helianthus annuus]